MTTPLTPFTQLGKTIATRQLEYPEWHKGRTRYGIWALEIDAHNILQRFHRAQQALADYLLPQYQRQPHITLYVCGFLDWLEPKQSQANDNFSQNTLEQQHAKLSKELKEITQSEAGFTLQVGAIDSFGSAPYLQVTDPHQHLSRLRTACTSLTEVDCSNEFRTSPYTPHLTLGLYRGSFNCRTLDEKFRKINRQHGFDTGLPLAVKALHFMSYASHCVDSPLRTELSVEA